MYRTRQLGGIFDEILRPVATAAGNAARAELERQNAAATARVNEAVTSALAPYTPQLVRTYGIPAALEWARGFAAAHKVPLVAGGALLAVALLARRRS